MYENNLADHSVSLLGGHSVPTLISQMREKVLTCGVFLSGEVIFSLGSLLVSDVTFKFRAVVVHRENSDKGKCSWFTRLIKKMENEEIEKTDKEL